MKKILLFLLAVLLVPAVLGESITLDTPIASEIISGATYNLSATVTLNENVNNVTFLYNDGGAWIPVGSELNTSANQSVYSFVFDTTTVGDGSGNYTFNATGVDLNQAPVVSDTSTSVSVDNTDPTATLTLLYPFIRRGGIPQVAECTVNDIVDSSLTDQIVLTQPDGSTVTESTDLIWQIDIQDTMYLDTADGYSANCSASDDEGHIGSSTSVFSVLSEQATKEEIKKLEQKKAEAKKSSFTPVLIVIVIAIIGVIGLGSYAVSQHKKSKKKRR